VWRVLAPARAALGERVDTSLQQAGSFAFSA
jgi:hypothetical protein